MRDVSPTTTETLSTSREVWSTLAVYYDGRPVLDELPIISGTLSIDGEQQVPGAVAVSVPRYITTETGALLDLLPNPDDPAPVLSADGTQIAVTYYVGLPGESAEAIELGWFRISEWDEGDDVVDLTAASLEARIQESRFLDPIQVADELFSEVTTRIVDGLLPLSIATSTDPVMPQQTFDEDRIGALGDVLAAWPARAYVDDSGTLVVLDAYDDSAPPVFDLRDGEDGTVVRAPRSGTRDGAYNAVKATGEAEGEVAPVTSTVYLTNGRRRWNGPFGNVPYFYSSPLLTTQAQAKAAATTRLLALQATTQSLAVEIVPDPRYEVGDVGTLTYRGRTMRVRIDALSLPLTYAGTMTLTVHELPEVA